MSKCYEIGETIFQLKPNVHTDRQFYIKMISGLLYQIYKSIFDIKYTGTY